MKVVIESKMGQTLPFLAIFLNLNVNKTILSLLILNFSLASTGCPEEVIRTAQWVLNDMLNLARHSGDGSSEGKPRPSYPYKTYLPASGFFFTSGGVNICLLGCGKEFTFKEVCQDIFADRSPSLLYGMSSAQSRFGRILNDLREIAMSEHIYRVVCSGHSYGGVVACVFGRRLKAFFDTLGSENLSLFSQEYYKEVEAQIKDGIPTTFIQEVLKGVSDSLKEYPQEGDWTEIPSSLLRSINKFKGEECRPTRSGKLFCSKSELLTVARNLDQKLFRNKPQIQVMTFGMPRIFSSQKAFNYNKIPGLRENSWCFENIDDPVIRVFANCSSPLMAVGQVVQIESEGSALDPHGHATYNRLLGEVKNLHAFPPGAHPSEKTRWLIWDLFRLFQLIRIYARIEAQEDERRSREGPRYPVFEYSERPRISPNSSPVKANNASNLFESTSYPK